MYLVVDYASFKEQFVRDGAQVESGVASKEGMRLSRLDSRYLVIKG